MGGGQLIPSDHVDHSKITTAAELHNQDRHESAGSHLRERPAKSRNCQAQEQQFPIRIITHNIRYAATSLYPGERPWSERLPYLLRQFYHYGALPLNPTSTIVCLQEVLHSQLRDLTLSFDAELQPAGQTWSYVGVGRDDGQQAGEYNPIFYRPDYWERIDSGTIWLSETPDQPSLGWDAGSNRLCTILVLESRPKPNAEIHTVMILNTHLDNAGPKARREGAKLIVRTARKWKAKYRTSQILLTGDLNSTRVEEHGAWQVFNETNSGIKDAEYLLQGWRRPPVKHFGDESTYTGFDGHGDDDEVGTLDFVHIGIEDGANTLLKVHSHTVVPNLFEDGIRCSDHRAVVVDLLI